MRAKDQQQRQMRRRWVALGWEGATTAAREEKRKEQVLDVFRALVEDSKRGVKAREFVVEWEGSW